MKAVGKGWMVVPEVAGDGRGLKVVGWGRRHCSPAVLAMLLLFAPDSEAHLVNTGFGPFYDGLSHLFLTPDELLGVLVLALLAGLRGARQGRWLALALPLAWLAGGILGVQIADNLALPLFTAGALLLMGLLVALDRDWPLPAVVGLATTFGLVQGLCNGSLAGQGAQGLGEMIGVTAAVAVVTTLGAALVVSLQTRPPWTRVAVRVAGSWVAAIGLLMGGWVLRS